MNIKKIIVILISFFCSFNTNYAMNGLRTYDSLLRLDAVPEKQWKINLMAEGDFRSAKGYNAEGCSVNVLQVYNCTENTLAMLKGFAPDSEIGQLNMLVDANDDGIRGHVVLNGKLNLNFLVGLVVGYQCTPHWGMSLYTTFESMELSDFSLCDLTRNVTESDLRVKQYLTNDLCGVVKRLGGLELGNWKRIGMGDTLALITWQKAYPQYRPLLKNVQLNGRVALVIPTGKRKDENKLLAFPFGFDGAVGILFGGGLDAQLGEYFKAGFDVQLMHLFGNTRDRRIKTDLTQSSFLILQKACTYRDFGMSQRFNLYIQFYHFLKYTSLLVGYQYNKHGDDAVSLRCLEFSSAIANSSSTLAEWTAHLIIVTLTHNFVYLVSPDACLVPQLSLFFRLPVEGKRSVLFPTIGGRLEFDF